ncbi:hypothetical protein C8Q76DRAFT_710739 [Earliella scabrosa]|nr:hypothetical protein C8Q76DRAFT_710739 [Earliella scabrosa]
MTSPVADAKLAGGGKLKQWERLRSWGPVGSVSVSFWPPLGDSAGASDAYGSDLLMSACAPALPSDPRPIAVAGHGLCPPPPAKPVSSDTEANEVCTLDVRPCAPSHSLPRPSPFPGPETFLDWPMTSPLPLSSRTQWPPVGAHTKIEHGSS